MYKYYIPYVLGGKTITDLSMGSITISTSTKICAENFDKSTQLIREKIVESEKARHVCTADQVLIINFILIPPFNPEEAITAGAENPGNPK